MKYNWSSENRLVYQRGELPSATDLPGGHPDERSEQGEKGGKDKVDDVLTREQMRQRCDLLWKSARAAADKYKAREQRTFLQTIDMPGSERIARMYYEPLEKELLENKEALRNNSLDYRQLLELYMRLEEAEKKLRNVPNIIKLRDSLSYEKPERMTTDQIVSLLQQYSIALPEPDAAVIMLELVGSYKRSPFANQVLLQLDQITAHIENHPELTVEEKHYLETQRDKLHQLVRRALAASVFEEDRRIRKSKE